MKKFEVFVKGFRFPSVLVEAKTEKAAAQAAANVLKSEGFSKATVVKVLARPDIK